VVTRALVAVALAGCRVAALDYEGKDCPCPDGYQCDLDSQTCTREGPSDSGTGPSDGSDGSLVSDSCLMTTRSHLIYSSVGFPDFPQAWTNAAGNWSKTGAMVTQTNSANSLAYIAHMVTTLGGVANYRVVATMSYVGSVQAGSVGIGLRVSSGLQPTMYTCTLDPVAGAFDLIVTQNQVDTPLQREFVVTSDPLKSYTMEASADGGYITCCVRDIVNAQLAMSNGVLTSGAVGVVTRDAEGSFTTFYVYD
jgi:hypothetical protein